MLLLAPPPRLLQLQVLLLQVPLLHPASEPILEHSASSDQLCKVSMRTLPPGLVPSGLLQKSGLQAQHAQQAGEGEQRGSWAGAERGEERAEAPTSLLFVSCGVWYSGSSRAPHASKNLATGPKVIHAPPCIFPS